MLRDNSLPYSSSGVDYDKLDLFKRNAQSEARKTSESIRRLGYRIVQESRGESATVIDEGDRYTAHVIEGLGTKNLVADQMRLQRLADQTDIATETGKITSKTYYDNIGQCTGATVFNDLITVGAMPILFNSYCAVGDSEWFIDSRRAEDLNKGLRRSCELAGAYWGGGETPALSGIIYPTAIDLAGSGYGVINPKSRLTIGDKEGGIEDKLQIGDAIFLVESNGIHANGLSLARKIAQKVADERRISLADAYATELVDGRTYGESLLDPTHIYAGFTNDLLEAGVDIHYLVNVTGHGWRKLMRANRELSYVIDQVPQVRPAFQFIQEQSGNSDREMYGNYNMGGGFAAFISEKDVQLAQKIAKENHGLQAGQVGSVEKGERQVVIRPKNITYNSETLGVR